MSRRRFDPDAFWANHRALLREYTEGAAGDDDRIRLLKEAVAAALTDGERTLLIAYAEAASLREVARLYGFRSPDAIINRLKVIRKKLTDYVEHHR